MTEFPVKAATILVVDDDEPFAAVIGEWLTVSGYAVTVACDGQDAFAKALQHPPDVVVADIRMPRMDGLQLLDTLKSYDRAIEVIFLSGQATLQDAVAALREGRGFDLLQKPLVDLERLNVTIERALSRRRGLPLAPEAPAGYSPPVERTLAYITDHIGTPIQVRSLATALGYSPSYLTDLVRRETGKSIQQWLIQTRVTLGERFLRETDLAVDTIARSVGYDDPSYFARQFRQHYGMAPLAWRAKHRQDPGRPSDSE